MYTFQITPDDGEQYEVVARMRDVLAWEKGNPGRAAQELSERVQLKDLYWIAHHAAKRQGLFTGTRQDFENTCDVVMGVQISVPSAAEDADGDGADPTRPAP